MAAELVTIRHKDHDKTNLARATVTAYESVWKDRGYVLVDPDTGDELRGKAATAAVTAATGDTVKKEA